MSEDKDAFIVSEIGSGGHVGKTVLSGYRAENLVYQMTRAMDEDKHNLHWVVFKGGAIWSRKKES